MWKFYKHKPAGPYKVGARDLAWLGNGDSKTWSNPPELLPDQHVVGRLFYPTTDQSWTLPVTWWIPNGNYAYGYANSLLFTVKGFKFAMIKFALRTLIYFLGCTTGIPVTYNASLLPESQQTPTGTSKDTSEQDDGLKGTSGPQVQGALPVVIFSHGLTGNRTTYSAICCELASQGYVVLALEHADGSAAAARLAGRVKQELPGVRGVWRYYGGWGGEEVKVARTRWRVKEVLAAHNILSSLNQGEDVSGLKVSGLSSKLRSPAGEGLTAKLLPDRGAAAGFFAGRLDMTRVAVVGHSWGGATAMVAASEHPQFGAAVCLDPWWESLPPEAVALHGQWLTQSPMLVIGSHDWNTPNAAGKLPCGGVEQQKVLAAAAQGQLAASSSGAGGGSGAGGEGAAAGQVEQAAGGPGALLLVPRGSTHHSFDDVMLFFGGMLEPVLKMFKFESKLDAQRALDITTQATTYFLRTHLPPVSGAQQPVPLQPQHAEAHRSILGPDLAIIKESFGLGLSRASGKAM